MSETTEQAPRTEWDWRIEQLKKKVEKCDRISRLPITTPSSAITGGSNRSKSLDRQLEQELNREGKAFRELRKAKEDLALLETRRRSFLAGEVHRNGQPRRDSPLKVRLRTADERHAAYVRAAVQVGDTVEWLRGGPDSRMVVRRKNPKSITDDRHGERWPYEDIAPLKEDGTPHTFGELRAKIDAYHEGQDA